MNKGYYSIIQFCPDISRQEAANIGVLLFCPELGFIRARTSESNERIYRFFGKESCDAARIEQMKGLVEKRLIVEADSFRSREDLEKFIATRANDLQLTPLRSVLLDNPEEELDRLFDLLVEEHLEDRSVGETPFDPNARPIWEVIMEIGKSIPDEEWDKVPTDLAENLHHYLYGDPKENER